MYIILYEVICGTKRSQALKIQPVLFLFVWKHSTRPTMKSQSIMQLPGYCLGEVCDLIERNGRQLFNYIYDSRPLYLAV